MLEEEQGAVKEQQHVGGFWMDGSVRWAAEAPLAVSIKVDDAGLCADGLQLAVVLTPRSYMWIPVLRGHE